jgi:polyhydroxyalkanoate synthesis regulator phasin
MEEKHILRDLFYLSVGSVAIAADRTEELLENFIKSNKVNAKEGKRIAKEYTKKAKQVKNEMLKKQDEFVNLLKDKLDMHTDDIRLFYNKMMDKPGEAKRNLKNNIDQIATQLSENTNLTIEQGRNIIEGFIDNMIEVKATIQSKSQEYLDEIQNKADDLKTFGSDFLNEMDFKTKELRDEISIRTESAIENLKDKLQLTAPQDVEELDGHVDKLEKKVLETKR